MKRLQTFFTIMLVNAFQVGCVHNYEPMINSIHADPNPAPTNSIVSLTCKASDDDESSMLKKETLDYEWSCAYGEVVSVDQDHNATWIAPDQPGEYSISCIVTDRFNGADIFTIDITVQ